WPSRWTASCAARPGRVTRCPSPRPGPPPKWSGSAVPRSTSGPDASCAYTAARRWNETLTAAPRIDDIHRMRRMMVGLAAAAAAAVVGLAALPASAAEVTISPGTAWKDTAGQPIQAHGGGMIKVGATWYWFGEDKTGESQDNAVFRNVPCYSSTDLAHWKFVANVL